MIGHPDLDAWLSEPHRGSVAINRWLEAPEILGCNDLHHARAGGCLWGAV